ncbi:MAG: dicarboxylate/amino acid:cation symporter [Bacteroidota bacterium]|nr:dicarboxylate/amino acid:cation symporter [Bacteroidota bacterium]
MQLHTKIIIGLILGLLVGITSVFFGISNTITNWVMPFGTIFVKMLKLVAVPLILVSLISGISNLRDTAKLSRIGGKTFSIYILTTVLAIIIALFLANIVQPGKAFPEEKTIELREKYASEATMKINNAEEVENSGPLQMMVDVVPDNFFFAASNNKNMLQIIFFAILFGIALIMIPENKGDPVKKIFDGVNQIIIKIVEIIMEYAPIGVFALLAGLIVDLAGDDPNNIIITLKPLIIYAITVLVGLAAMVFLFYPSILYLITKIGYKNFFKAIFPAQMLAFSTSSSAATLPLTMKRVKKNLNVSEEVTSFVCPLGATINMDGTSIHQAISAVFIAQAFGQDLTIADQLVIIVTATLSSIGAAAVPGAGLIMLVIVLGAVGIDPQGLALIIAIDRPLDMCRTIVNVTGDATVASIVAHTEGENVKFNKDE